MTLNDVPTTGLAIIGMDARLGGCESLDDFANGLYDGFRRTDSAPGMPSTTLIQQVIAGALHDAGIVPDRSVALILAATEDIAQQSIAAWRLHGPAYVAPPGAALSALETAGALLAENRAETVVLAASDDAGVGALALRRADHLSHAGRAYAVVEGIGHDLEEAFRRANVSSADIGYLELNSIMPEDDAEIAAIHAAYRVPSPDLVCAVGSVSANLGQSGIASLIKTALCLYHRFIPAVPGWQAPSRPILWQDSPFYVAPKSKTWFLASGSEKRVAAVSGAGVHVVLSEGAAQGARHNTYLRRGPLHLLLVSADDREALLDRLHALDRAVRNRASLRAVASEYFAAYRPEAAYALAIVGRSKEELTREIQHALSGVAEALATGGAWSTPLGSYFTANPLGRKGAVTFVYPGAFSSYPKMGQDLFHLFPHLHEDLLDSTSDLSRSVGERWLYARSLEKQSTRQWRAFRRALEDHPAAMMESGITAAVMYTRIARDVFKIRPGMAMGYSLGEGSMLWGLGVWMDGDAGHAALHSSPVLRDRLFGPKRTIREMWGLSDEADDDFWSVYFLSASPEAVEAQLRREPRVYLTHINTPHEVVIAGESEACRRVVTALQCEHLHAPFSMVIHCEATLPEYAHFFTLHHYPVRNRPDVTFYAAADYAPTTLDQTVLAHNISRAACKPLDFPRLVNRVYEDGARIFIELGPRSTCARWISETLGEREHLAVSINHLGVDDRTALVRMLAKLASHRLPLDLSPLHETLSEPVTALASADWQAALSSPFENVNRAHAAFLQGRHAALQYLGEALQLQMALLAQAQPAPVAAASPVPAAAHARPGVLTDPLPEAAHPPAYTPSPALFDERAIEEFATGSVVACFGPDYTIYEDRRAPRIPNGDLLLISRIVAVDGERLKLTPNSRIVSEYDMPVDPWFYRDNAYPSIPYSIYMEMALQLCGFLSAYLGSTLLFPELDFYFRNLDGQGKLYRDDDWRGRTITNEVYLLSSITMEGIILQKFSFRLSCEGEVFYEGEASFGCFTAEAMLNQAGLDKGRPTLPWYREQELPDRLPVDLRRLAAAPPARPHYRLAARQLNFLDNCLIIPGGGRYGQGYVYASEELDPADWFFARHFHEDPVMPGSLGVEAILQAMQAYAIAQDLGRQFRSPRFGQALNHEIVWRYRGQVLPTNRRIDLEVHIKRIEYGEGQVTIIGDASLWRDDGLRIYEVQEAALCIAEAVQ